MITCERDDLIDACIFYLKELLPNKKLPSIEIDLYEMHTLKGWCSPEDNGYLICLDNTQPIEIMLTTLAHECVHIKQYELGELVDKNGENYWFGEQIKSYAYEDYYNLPWEKEAYEKELMLLDNYMKNGN